MSTRQVATKGRSLLLVDVGARASWLEVIDSLRRDRPANRKLRKRSFR